MKIQSLMIKNPITIGPHASVSESIELMKANSIRHLPVVTRGKRLEGFLTLADLKQGLIPSMLGDVSLDDLMIKNPITVSPDDDIEFIFDRFWKSDRARTHIDGAGSGLGLAISKKLIEAQGGTIKVRSQVGQGTKFTIDLPSSNE